MQMINLKYNSSRRSCAKLRAVCSYVCSLVAKYDDFEEHVNIEVFVLLTPVLYSMVFLNLPLQFPMCLFWPDSEKQKMVGEMKHLIHYAHSSNNYAK